MKVQSLAELKAENEAKANAKTESDLATVEEAAKLESETEESNGDVESWQIESKDDEQEEQPQAMPVSAHVKMKAKLKGKLAEKDSELEEVKAKLAALERGAMQQPATKPSAVRPKLEDFGYDDDKYQAALDVWFDEKINEKVNKTNQVSNQKNQLQASQKLLEKAVDEHYERAAILAQKSGITAEVYQAADMQFRSAIDEIFPGRGDAIADHLISTLGDNSEKVTFFIGRNVKAQNELKAALAADPSGVKAAVYIGKKAAEIMQSVKKGSQAPTPAPVLKGDSNATGSQTAKKLQKDYQEAHAKGNLQKAWNLKKEAKKAGVNTNDW